MQVQLAASRGLQLVIDQKRSLDEVMDKFMPPNPEQQGEFREICYGSCRHYLTIDALLKALLSKPLKTKDRIVHFLLVVAIYQINHMRTPDHAAVNQCVKALGKTRQTWAKGLVNGVLRNYLRERETLNATIANPATQYGFPDFFAKRLQQSWPDHYLDLMKVANEHPPMTLRVNQRKTTRNAYVERLQKAGITFSLTKDSQMGLTLGRPMPVEKIPGFIDGLVSVQDESAQLAVQAMVLAPNFRVLDGCAAPGGKTCAILEAQPVLDHLIAIDFEKRMSGLKENLARLELSAELICGDLVHVDEWWDGQPFDRILLDVPCSGSGVVRRHPDIKHRRNDEDFDKFADRQLEILRAAWSTLAADGVLIYVTCSVMECENDGVIGRFIEQNPNAAIDSLDSIFGIETRFGRQRLPGSHDGDGFYYCRLKHTGT